MLLQGVWKLFVEQLLRLRLLVSLNESLWGPQVLAARSFDRGLPGHSRPCFPRVGTFSCPLLPTIFNGTFRTIHLASNMVHRPACSFHPDDQASLKLA
ncbi:hypothetical protein TNCV_2745081 [Trichonephila clavipes]|nr:hypothetical protein TNCV_2745081 [Trichonephila clavipes]